MFTKKASLLTWKTTSIDSLKKGEMENLTATLPQKHSVDLRQPYVPKLLSL